MYLTEQKPSPSDSGQAGAPFSAGCIFNEIEGFNDRRLKGLDGIQNSLALKGLSVAEAYLKGVLWVAVEYRPTGAGEFAALALVNNQRDTVNPAACFRAGFIDKIQPLDRHFRESRDQHEVLVGDVQSMETVESELPAFVWLYLIQDCPDHRVAWRNSLKFMAIDGTLNRLPVLSEGEPAESVKRRVVGFGGDVIRVIEGGAEVVERIAQNRGRMFGERSGSSDLPAFQKAVLALGPQSFHVLMDEVPENGFKISDVLFGPFNL